ncbi:Hypothetical predicted protein [Octopus vulgaris]|uniref:Uncharacterized protein n=1 Tax=Octopus vulgaris TaxID=6645 RepID=A0AA36BDU9_OCTVU|nr:Hypothetical predicted protein [Octopus vulgaris]
MKSLRVIGGSSGINSEISLFYFFLTPNSTLSCLAKHKLKDGYIYSHTSPEDNPNLQIKEPKQLSSSSSSLLVSSSFCCNR